MIDSMFIIWIVVESVNSGQYMDKICLENMKNIKKKNQETIKWYLANFHITCLKRLIDSLLDWTSLVNIAKEKALNIMYTYHSNLYGAENIHTSLSHVNFCNITIIISPQK